MNNETIQIHLNSKFATNYNNQHYSDCGFSLPLIEVQSQYTIYLSIIHCVIPYSFYNINSTNNVLCYSEYLAIPPVITTIYIPYGNYNALQLATYLTNNLPRTSVTYNTITNKFVFSNSANDFKIVNASSSCQNLIGLSNDDLYNTSIGKSLTLPKQVNLAQTRMINIATNFQTGCINNIKLNEQDILACVPVIKNPYSLIDYTNISNLKVNLNTNSISYINIKLLDQDGKSLELNQQFFSITLQLEIVNFVE
jgi:hypothetical protein